MPDEVDMAQQVEILDREVAIHRAVQPRREKQLITPGGKVICRGCGEYIPPERLKALPTAARCVECQRLLENGRCL